MIYQLLIATCVTLIALFVGGCIGFRIGWLKGTQEENKRVHSKLDDLGIHHE